MRYWFDTEFIEDGKTIDLISIGIASEDGRTYYAELVDCDLSRASPWVKDNVIVHLQGEDAQKTRQRVATDIVDFVSDGIAKDGLTPEFWAYYADYDWVALCQLYGTMMELPNGWPMYCRDVKQFADGLGNPPLPKQSTAEHHALSDAQWTKAAWYFLANLADEATP